MHDGSLVCFQVGHQGLEWATEFAAPVASVFDVAISHDADGIQPVVLPQPELNLQAVVGALRRLPESAFIGRLGKETLYAMSTDHYPLVAFAPGKSEYGDDDQGLLGLQRLQPSRSSPDTGLEGPPERLGIDAPAAAPSPSSSSTSQSLPPFSISINSTPMSPPYREAVRGDNHWTTTTSILIALALCLLSARWIYGANWESELDKRLRVLARSSWLGRQIGRHTEQPSPSSSQAPSTDGEFTNDFATVQDNRSLETILAKADKELPPLPPETNEKPRSAEEGDSEGESGGDDRDGAVVIGKRKGRRRKRGRKTGQRAKAEAAASADVVENQTVNEVTEDSVGALVVSNSILGALTVAACKDRRANVSPTGYGSHGTVVLRGTFQGRAVAVKRLLKDFTTIATHEVALLQESDDHAHVIRYYCKEQRDDFLYIALELCPASLADLIENESSYGELAKMLDQKRALRQITSGLAHLHKLKIVHRDIKPHNILVAPSRGTKGGTGSGLRMLISDFGLCKKLEMDESSFAQTTHHAAGSYGYRAPEVLRGEVNPNETEVGASESNTHSSTGSTSTAVEGKATGKRARLTRSIDLFALGCLFYYVLTHGDHPFGGRYEREVNILKGQSSVDGLESLGDEAVEAQDLVLKMVAAEAEKR
jgi:serine/threonine-protein kinase/endoribonuclease IRE1